MTSTIIVRFEVERGDALIEVSVGGFVRPGPESKGDQVRIVQVEAFRRFSGVLEPTYLRLTQEEQTLAESLIHEKHEQSLRDALMVRIDKLEEQVVELHDENMRLKVENDKLRTQKTSPAHGHLVIGVLQDDGREGPLQAEIFKPRGQN